MASSMLSLEGKVALITGIGTVGPGWGNGKAMAVLFARQGAKIVGADINLSAIEETRRIIEQEGGQCVVAEADVMNADQIDKLVSDCVAQFGTISMLVKKIGGSVSG